MTDDHLRIHVEMAPTTLRFVWVITERDDHGDTVEIVTSLRSHDLPSEACRGGEIVLRALALTDADDRGSR